MVATLQDHAIYGEEFCDRVRCNQCMWHGWVHQDSENCPSCGFIGGLADFTDDMVSGYEAGWNKEICPVVDPTGKHDHKGYNCVFV